MKVCFVGAGSIGKRHIRNLSLIAREEGYELYIDLLRSSHRSLDDDILHLIQRECFSIDELDRGYDAIFITNPTNLHYDCLINLFDRSDNFFVEKPVFDRTDVDLTVFDNDEKSFYVACPLRYTGVLQEAEKLVRNGEKVLSVRAISSSYLPDWRPGTDYRNTYSAHADQGGGVRIDLIHEWDYLMHLFGKPEKVLQVYGKYSDLEIDSEDLAVYLAEYPDKVIELHLDYFGRNTQRYCEIITTETDYVFDIAGNRILKCGQEIKRFDEKPNDKYISEMREFLRIIKKETENKNDLRCAIESLKIAAM